MRIRTFDRRHVLQGAAALALTSGQAHAADGFTFMTLGDWGSGKGGQRRVAAKMTAWAKANDARFVMTVGDNFYPDGVSGGGDKAWKTLFEDVYALPRTGADGGTAEIPWYPALGNHDYHGDLKAQIDYRGRDKRWRMGGTYYKAALDLPAGGPTLDAFMIDTTPICQADTKPGSHQYDNIKAQDVAAQQRWLEAALACSTADWKLVFGHHAVLSGGFHKSDKVLDAWLTPLLTKYGAHAYVAGHDHDMQHLKRDGLDHVGTGGGGGDSRSVRKLTQTQWCRGGDAKADYFGFTGFRVGRETLQVEFIGDAGAADALKPDWTATIARARPGAAVPVPCPAQPVVAALAG